MQYDENGKKCCFCGKQCCFTLGMLGPQEEQRVLKRFLLCWLFKLIGIPHIYKFSLMDTHMHICVYIFIYTYVLREPPCRSVLSSLWLSLSTEPQHSQQALRIELRGSNIKIQIHPFPVFTECFYKSSLTWWKQSAFLFFYFHLKKQQKKTRPHEVLTPASGIAMKRKPHKFKNSSKERRGINKRAFLYPNCLDSTAFMWDIYSFVFACKLEHMRRRMENFAEILHLLTRRAHPEPVCFKDTVTQWRLWRRKSGSCLTP